MLNRRFHTILSFPVFLYLYAYTTIIVFLVLILACANVPTFSWRGQQDERKSWPFEQPWVPIGPG